MLEERLSRLLLAAEAGQTERIAELVLEGVLGIVQQVRVGGVDPVAGLEVAFPAVLHEGSAVAVEC